VRVERVCFVLYGKGERDDGKKVERRCEQSRLHCYDLPAQAAVGVLLVEGISSFKRLSLSSCLATHFNEDGYAFHSINDKWLLMFYFNI